MKNVSLLLARNNFWGWQVIVAAILLTSCAEVPPWRIQTTAKALGNHSYSITAIIFSKDGETVYSADSSGRIKGWSIPSAMPVANFHAKGHSVAFSPNGERALSGNRNVVKILNLTDGKVQKVIELGPDSFPFFMQSAHLSKDGAKAVLLFRGGNVSAWDLVEGRELNVFQTPIHLEFTKATLAYSPVDSVIMLVPSAYSFIEIRDLASGNLLRIPFLHEKGKIRASAFTSDGTAVATVDTKNIIRLWSIKSGEEISIIDGSAVSGIDEIIFSSFRKLIITGHNDGFITLWNLETGMILKQFKAHDGWVKAMALSKDGRSLVSGGPDKKVKLWNLANILTD